MAHTSSGGYEKRGREEKKWALVQKAFNAFHSSHGLDALETVIWTERMVIGYEERGCEEEAWELTRTTLHAIRHVGQFVELSTLPWVERTMSGYEKRG